MVSQSRGKSSSKNVRTSLIARQRVHNSSMQKYAGISKLTGNAYVTNGFKLLLTNDAMRWGSRYMYRYYHSNIPRQIRPPLLATKQIILNVGARDMSMVTQIIKSTARFLKIRYLILTGAVGGGALASQVCNQGASLISVINNVTDFSYFSFKMLMRSPII